MPTNLTDRLGELIGCAESGAASDRSQLAHFVLNHKDEILSALRKAEQPAPGYYAELRGRLRRKRQAQPAFGSGSISVNQGGSLIASTSQITDDGMRLVNPDGPEAATAIERLTAEVTRLREQLAKDATRFEVCAGMIANSHKASGTLRAERTIKARHFAGEALDTLRGTSSAPAYP